jgi:hypothetical protein
MSLPKFRTGLSACAFGGVEKGAAAKNLPLNEAVPWHVIDMPWDCNLMLNEMTLTALPATRRQSTATDHSREDSPAIKVNRYFNSRWNNPSTGLEACFNLSTSGDGDRRREAKPAKDGNGEANLISRHTGCHAARNGQGFHTLKRGKSSAKCFRIGGDVAAGSEAGFAKVWDFGSGEIIRLFVAFAHGKILCVQVDLKKGQWQKSAPESGLAVATH